MSDERNNELEELRKLVEQYKREVNELKTENELFFLQKQKAMIINKQLFAKIAELEKKHGGKPPLHTLD